MHTLKARNPESHIMSDPRDETTPTGYANVNLKVSEEEKWAYKVLYLLANRPAAK